MGTGSHGISSYSSSYNSPLVTPNTPTASGNGPVPPPPFTFCTRIYSNNLEICVLLCGIASFANLLVAGLGTLWLKGLFVLSPSASAPAVDTGVFGVWNTFIGTPKNQSTYSLNNCHVFASNGISSSSRFKMNKSFSLSTGSTSSDDDMLSALSLSLSIVDNYVTFSLLSLSR